jgi:hypothetical protein
VDAPMEVVPAQRSIPPAVAFCLGELIYAWAAGGGHPRPSSRTRGALKVWGSACSVIVATALSSAF